ncbi:MAG: hypothetical protein ACXVOH_03820 [Bacteroidia bacterium]
MNSGASPINVEIKLNKNRSGFPIFHYRNLYVHEAPNDKIKDTEREILADTLEDISHFKFILSPHTAVEIGELQNDKYENHNQHFINDRIFNLESLILSSGGKETKIVPETFDTYFKKEKSGDIYYHIR